MTRYFAPGLRLAARVKRWPTVETIRQHSIAEHMFFVAHYASDVAKLIDREDLMLQVLTVALRHDREETITGDIPGPVKRWSTTGYTDPMKMGGELIRRFGPSKEWEAILGHDEYRLIMAIVKVADVADQLMEAATEVSLGNELWGGGMWQSALSQLRPAILGLRTIEGVNKEVEDKIVGAAVRMTNRVTMVGVDSIA